MSEAQPLNESVLARETLKRLSEPGSILTRAATVLELVAHSTVGLGEVLQDYAHQTVAQLKEVIHAADHVTQGTAGAAEAQALATIHHTLKSVKSVLERTPAAMERNKAATIGEKEKFSGAQIAEVTHALLTSPDVAALLANEDSGLQLAALAPSAVVLPPDATRRVAASH